MRPERTLNLKVQGLIRGKGEAQSVPGESECMSKNHSFQACEDIGHPYTGLLYIVTRLLDGRDAQIEREL